MIWIWFAFILFVLLMLALDLGVFHRKAHVVRLREALAWSAVWIAMGLAFAGFVYFGYERQWLGLGTAVDAVDGKVNDGAAATVKYLTGYVVEKSLSVDNVFVIAMIFAFLAVPPVYQHRVLFWGIIGALAMRGVMIAVGAKLIAEFHWILYVFGVFLIVTAAKMLLIREHADPSKNLVVRAAKRLFPVTDRFHGQHFFVRAGSDASRAAPAPGEAVEHDDAVSRLERARPGAIMMTPLFLALLMVEVTDLIFAVDSIPAIFAITADPFLVFTSNVFAILGLRSLYFALAGMIHAFRYLKVSLAAVLALVGAKMLAAGWLKEMIGANFNLYLLAVVLLILATGVAASVVANHRDRRDRRTTDPARDGAPGAAAAYARKGETP
jgi:tellurite resistance protein TerC